MANQEQLEILKQGVDIWNGWLEKNRETQIDLREADLRGIYLQYADLRKIDFSQADLSRANLSGAYLSESNLSGANLSETNLSRALFIRTDLYQVDLRRADLRGAHFSRASLIKTNLGEADLRMAHAGPTIFGDIDLSEAIGLDEMDHFSPSTVGTDAMQRSKGKMPVKFLRGCGLSDFEIESSRLYNPDLNNHEIADILYRIHDLRAHQSVQVSPLFISYSHADAAFVDRLEVVLDDKGIRFWRDIHDAKAGRLETQIEQAIRHNPTVLVVLSKNSIQSDWVQHEVRKARALEKELGRDVLCPVALDGSWKDSPWPERVMEQIMEYNILDFSKWDDGSSFEKMFVKLLDGLQLFYKT